MFTSNFGRAGSRKDTKDMAQGVCCQAGDNGFCRHQCINQRAADSLTDLRTGQDTTGCADALRERRCLHVAIIVAMFLLVVVLMGLPYRTNALCGRSLYEAIKCYYWAAVASLFIFAAAGPCLACLCLNDRVRQNTPEALSANLARYKAHVAIRARLRAALSKGDQEAAAPIVEELIENLDVRPAEP